MAIFPIEKPPLVMPGGRLWLDAFDTPTGSTTTWVDKFGTGHNPTQATAGFRPVNTANQQAGKNGMVFTAANTTWLASASFTALSQPCTTYVVAKITPSTIGYFVDGITSGNRNAVFKNSTNYNLFGGSATLGTGALNNANPHIQTSIFNGATSSIYMDNASSASGTTGSNTITGYTIGSRWDQNAGNYVDGVIFEILIFTGAHTVAQVTYMNRYLSNKWGVSIS